MAPGDGGDEEGLVSWEGLGSFRGFWFRVVSFGEKMKKIMGYMEHGDIYQWKQWDKQ